MRDIKFRAWNTEYKNGMCYSTGGGGFNYRWFEKPHRNIQLMQYTGLKDKNGVEIYEGDIVRLIRESGSLRLDVIIKEVKWQKIGWAAYVAWHDIEVIGNIYENPGLLALSTSKDTNGRI